MACLFPSPWLAIFCPLSASSALNEANYEVIYTYILIDICSYTHTNINRGNRERERERERNPADVKTGC